MNFLLILFQLMLILLRAFFLDSSSELPDYKIANYNIRQDTEVLGHSKLWKSHDKRLNY